MTMKVTMCLLKWNCKGSMHVGVSEDGIRIGDPAEEVNFYCLSSMDYNVHMIGVPQAFIIVSESKNIIL